MPSIDLNADLGEGYGRWRVADEAAVLPLVSSASIACGFHAGDPLTMRESVRLAVRHGVAVGAHPGLPDLRGFGRRDMQLAPDEITADVLYQVGALHAVCRAEGARLRYVKPHGALYNRAAVDDAVAGAVADGVRLAGADLVLLALAGSALARAGERLGLRVAREAFADRAYRADATLLPRTEPGAVLDADGAAAQAIRIARDGAAVAVDGTALRVEADSLCVHGDNPHAPAALASIRAALAAAGIAVAPFAA